MSREKPISYRGSWLAAARHWLRWSQKEAAAAAGVLQSSVSDIEAREVCRPTQAVRKLLEAYAAAGVEILPDGTIRPVAQGGGAG